MTTLRASILGTLSTFLAFGSPQGSFADGRGDWDGYAWQTIEISQCLPDGPMLDCPLYHEKWDWKRDQWVDLSVALDTASGQVTLTQTLTDHDGTDRDYVCVTALVSDVDGNTLVAHHQNWRMGPGDTRSATFRYPSSHLEGATAIHIGSKQCREGQGQDDGLYQAVLAAIAP